MSATDRGIARDDELLEQFVRLFGRPPTHSELALFRRSHISLLLRLPARSRRRAASLLAHL